MSQKQSHVFRIDQTQPIAETGCTGCFIFLFLISVAVSSRPGNGNLTVIFASVAIICAALLVSLRFRVWKRRKYESKFNERIELLPEAILYFDKQGELQGTIRTEDIQSLARYQGIDKNRTPFDDCVIHLTSGKEFVLPKLIERRRHLIKQIERRTGFEFRYRKNSSRNQT